MPGLPEELSLLFHNRIRRGGLLTRNASWNDHDIGASESTLEAVILGQVARDCLPIVSMRIRLYRE
jgi:hypothetical protein